jgi:NAD(P)-dependent dehydrogenase (short-subunit alcohol dehydrogenase family)
MAEQDWLGLRDRVAVVSGAGGGIGGAVATLLAQAGARLALLDCDEARCLATADGIRPHGAETITLTVDITDQAAVEAAAAHTARELGPPDVLVNNAGILQSGPLASVSLSDWNALLSVNLTGYLLCAQAFGRAMLERKRGTLVHIASIAGRYPQGFSGAYSASKAGVIMLSQQCATEWGPSGVRSNVVSPGLVRTPMSEAFYQSPGVAARRAGIVPLQRVARPEDIAKVVLFLCSDLAGYVNGEDICVDGGFGRTLMAMVPRPGFEG